MTTDEIYEVAARAMCDLDLDPECGGPACEDCHDRAGLAVDAVAPLLRAEGRREAAQAIRATKETIGELVEINREMGYDGTHAALRECHARIAEGGAP